MSMLQGMRMLVARLARFELQRACIECYSKSLIMSYGHCSNGLLRHTLTADVECRLQFHTSASYYVVRSKRLGEKDRRLALSSTGNIVGMFLISGSGICTVDAHRGLF